MRCQRCHHAAPNPEGCAACNPDRLGARLLEVETALAVAREDLETAAKVDRALEEEAAHLRKLRNEARAAAIEEAADIGSGADSCVMNHQIAERIRALATLPASLCVVERENLEKVRGAMRGVIDFYDLDLQGDETAGTAYEVAEACVAALALLERTR